METMDRYRKTQHEKLRHTVGFSVDEQTMQKVNTLRQRFDVPQFLRDKLAELLREIESENKTRDSA